MAARIAIGLRQAAFAPRTIHYQARLSPRCPQHMLTSAYRRSRQAGSRYYSDVAIEPVEPPEYLSQGERKVFDMLKDGLQPTKLEVGSRETNIHHNALADVAYQVQDVSGGCGSMYALDIVSDQFKGLSIIKQHRLVNTVLGEEIKKWHGVQLKTKAP